MPKPKTTDDETTADDPAAADAPAEGFRVHPDDEAAKAERRDAVSRAGGDTDEADKPEQIARNEFGHPMASAQVLATELALRGRTLVDA